MRNIIIFILLLFVSCKSSKDSVVESSVEPLVEPLVIDSNSLSLQVEPLVIESKSLQLETVSSFTNVIDSIRIIDKTVTFIDSVSVMEGFGTIAYNVPYNLRVNELSTIRLRISMGHNVSDVVLGDRDIPIVGVGSNDLVILETIRISSLMRASLYTDDGLFEVSGVSSKEQTLLDGGYTEWIWRIKPIKSGRHYIKMLITVSDRDIVVYEKQIPVESNWYFSFSNWVVRWWESLLAGLIVPIVIPFIIWWRNRNKKIIKK